MVESIISGLALSRKGAVASWGALASVQPSFPSGFTFNHRAESNPARLYTHPFSHLLNHVAMSAKPKIPSWQRVTAEKPAPTESEAGQH